ncbi:MAG: hypothetical protein J7M38_03020 [Armatimonadetes bacterium]|nr:hypothetical protein [Armatimonadota bacterium]
MQRGLIGVAALAALAAGLALWYFVLRPPALSDRRQIVELVANLERAVEQRRTSTVMRCISADYEDGYGLTRPVLQRLIVEAARDPEPIDVVIQLSDIAIEPDGSRASAHIEADYALGEPVGMGESTHISVDVVFRRERGGWKIIRADGWQASALEM